MHNDERSHTSPLLGSIANGVGFGFLGNEAIVAIAQRMRLRTITVPSAYASARGGIDGRMVLTIDIREFRRGVEFLIANEPAVLVVGFLPKPDYVEAVADALRDYHGLVVLDPVLGSFKKGLYVSPETARTIRDRLIGAAQVVTPNRFEAEVLLGISGATGVSERAFLDRFAGLGPTTVLISSYLTSDERRSAVSLFSNGYRYERITGPRYPSLPAFGAGDVLTGAVAALLARKASPLAAAVHATALASASVERGTAAGGGTVDPVAALETYKPLPVLEDDQALKYAERFGVTSQAIAAADGEKGRLQSRTRPT